MVRFGFQVGAIRSCKSEAADGNSYTLKSRMSPDRLHSIDLLNRSSPNRNWGVGILARVARGEIEGERSMQCLGGDNNNTYNWIYKRRARTGAASEMMSAAQLRIARYGLGPIPFFLRPRRILTTDFLTRANTQSFGNRGNRRAFKLMNIPRGGRGGFLKPNRCADAAVNSRLAKQS